MTWRIGRATGLLVGAMVGAVGTWLALLLPMVGLLAYTAAGIGLVRLRRAAPAGGALLATGAWFASLTHRMIANCDAINRGGGICQMGDTTVGTLTSLAFLAAGMLLSVYGLAKDRP